MLHIVQGWMKGAFTVRVFGFLWSLRQFLLPIWHQLPSLGLWLRLVVIVCVSKPNVVAILIFFSRTLGSGSHCALLPLGDGAWLCDARIFERRYNLPIIVARFSSVSRPLETIGSGVEMVEKFLALGHPSCENKNLNDST